MKRCWHYSPDKRPGFMEIRNELDSMFEQAGGEEDYYYYKRWSIKGDNLTLYQMTKFWT